MSAARTVNAPVPMSAAASKPRDVNSQDRIPTSVTVQHELAGQ
jgi:hypothetical protein